MIRRSLGRALAAAVLAALGPGAARAHPDVDTLERAVDGKLAQTPGDAALLLKHGRLREMARDWDGALAAIEHARDHGAAPDTVAAARARVFRAAGFPRMAKIEYDRVLALRPDAFEMLFERARVALLLGRPEEADADFARAIAGMTAPRPEQVIEWRDARLARGRAAQAIEALDAGIARLGPVAALELAAVDLEVELHRWDGALARLDVLLARSPGNPAWVARRGELLERAGRRDEARAEFARALRQIESRPAGRRAATRELEQRLRLALDAPAAAHQEEP